jgi:hypothetical protein
LKAQKNIAHVLIIGLAWADATSGCPDNKSDYTLFHPTPNHLLREMSTDRPDKTESPYTVDAGHFQLEMDLFTYTRDHDTAGKIDRIQEDISLAPMNLKVGLLNHVDLQLILSPFNRQRTQDRVGGTVRTSSGFGDVVTRLKVNLWGNDGGATAAALMPFVRFPSSQDGLGNNAGEGGFIIPFAIRLPHNFGMGLMTEVDFNENSNNNHYHAEFVNSITLNRGIIGELAGYVEFFSNISNEARSPWIGTADFGFTYALSANAQLDAGLNMGITEAAEDFNPFIGFSIRL